MILYELGKNLYVNLTNKCSNACIFCIRTKNEHYLSDQNLWLKNDATYQEFLSEVEKFDIDKYAEIVFCGYGEPTYKLDVLLEIADYFKGKKLRINTNGHGNIINKRNIVPELAEKIDTISISLNGADEDEYQATCKSVFSNGHAETIDFAKKCVSAGIKTQVTVLEGFTKNLEICREIARDIGAELVVRKKEGN